MDCYTLYVGIFHDLDKGRVLLGAVVMDQGTFDAAIDTIYVHADEFLSIVDIATMVTRV